MKKYLLNLSLIKKMLLSGSAALLSLTLLGYSYFSTVSQLEINKVEIIKSETSVKKVLEMKFAMAHSLKLLMEIITTDNKADFEMFWNEHLAIVKDYELHYDELDSLLNDNTWGANYADTKANIKKTASQVDQFHDSHLQASMLKVHDLRILQLAGDSSAASSINQLDDDLDKAAEGVLVSVDNMTTDMDKLSYNIQIESDRLANKSKLQGLILIILGILISIVSFYYLIKYMINIINQLNETVKQLSQGKLPAKIETDSSDELGQITNSLNILTTGLYSTSNFANEIGSGNFDLDFKPLSSEDVLGESLLKMRNNLKNVAEDDKRRSWATEGMAQFADVLRNNNQGLEVLANNIITNLVKYVGANQGGLFIVNDANPKDRYLELISCYAWDKKKHIDKRVNEGEGLVGQSWQEADVVYITEVPTDFVSITSGLGGANPRCIIIVPLTVNEVTYGVFEIASFNLFEDYQIEFMKKLAESIASTLSGAKTNERTKVLLEQSQQNAEEMRAQEEEMRQNMEEMQATSEEAERKAMNYEAAIARLNDEIAELSKR